MLITAEVYKVIVWILFLLLRWMHSWILQMLLFKATYNAFKVYMLLVHAFSKNRTHDASVASTCSTVLSVSWKREEWGVKLCFRCFWRVIVCVWWRDRRADGGRLSQTLRSWPYTSSSWRSERLPWPAERTSGPSSGLTNALTFTFMHEQTLLSKLRNSNVFPKNFKSAQPQAIQDQDEFVSSSGLEKCLSNGCSAVNGCRQNER